ASLDQLDGAIALRLLMGEHPGEVQRVGLIGCHLEDAAVDVRSGSPLLGSLQRKPDRHGFVDGERAVVSGRLLHDRRGARSPALADRHAPGYPALLALMSYLK